VRDVSKDIEAGISAVQELFKSNRLFIHSSCTNLIWELETYAYPDKKPDHNEAELPIKENDHAVDTLRYVLYMQAPVGISTQAKQFVPNHTGARRGYQLPNGYES
jgi:phage terminase large subunit